MSAQHDPGPGRERGAEPDPAQELARFPRLDAEGMIADDDEHEPAPLPGPSPLLPSLVTAVGVGLTVLAVVDVVRTVPAPGGARPMNAAVLAASLALGGYSLTRLLQLLALAGSRRRRRSAGAELPPVRWQLFDAHSLHAVWVIAVGASIALMGLLGVWSLLDGRPSGLEPGWPLLLCGGAVALLAHLAGRRTSRCWQEADGAQQIGHR
ncbi:MAG TPA: hypothetical protein VK122_04755 [Brachybacterium sp.]|nr:hypothetical protein [Brachybacterium sp.]